jgi:hypothetical protein
MHSIFVFLLLGYEAVGMASDVSEQQFPSSHSTVENYKATEIEGPRKLYVNNRENLNLTKTGQFQGNNLQITSQHVLLAFNLQVAALVAMLFSKKL